MASESESVSRRQLYDLFDQGRRLLVLRRQGVELVRRDVAPDVDGVHTGVHPRHLAADLLGCEPESFLPVDGRQDVSDSDVRELAGAIAAV